MPAGMGWGLVQSEGVEQSPRPSVNRGAVRGLQEEADHSRSEKLSCLAPGSVRDPRWVPHRPSA